MADITVAQDQMILGAQRAVLALRAIEELAAAAENPDTTMEQHYASEQSAINELVNASGADNDQMKGFIAGIAEYLHMCNFNGVPNLDVWKPAASMTPAELADYRKAMQESD